MRRRTWRRPRATRAISKTNDNGSGCSADGNLVAAASIYDALLAKLQDEGGYVVNEKKRRGFVTPTGTAGPPDAGHDRAARARRRGEGRHRIAAGKTFLIVPETNIGKAHLFSTEKLGIVLAMFKYSGFDEALGMVARIFETGGRGHSCGIYSFNDEHIHRLALMAPVSRIMVRQIQSRANAGTFTNGMPMTSSMGCGTWGGNITNENISLKHYMNVTWVSRPTPEDRPSEEELFGEFYNSPTFDAAPVR